MNSQESERPNQDQTPGADVASGAPSDNGIGQTAEIRIYVACLAAYNNGRLHGRWIDATLGEAHIWEEVSAMLAASPEPQAEEWAIHNYEGFEGVPLSEYSDCGTVVALADFINERGALGGKLLEHFGGDLSDASAAFEEYSGEYKSLADYAQDLTEQTGPEIPKQLEYYIDWDAMGRDMEMSGDIFTVETGFEEIHVFWAR